MKTEDRKVLKEIKRHQELETNLPVYGNAYINSVYEYNLIRLVLNYYTLKEVFDEGGTIHSDNLMVDTLEKIHTIIFETLMNNNDTDIADCIERLDAIRNELTDRMVVLTAYTDALQIYEYVLNRVEYGITNATYDVDVDKLSERLFKYIFNDMIIKKKSLELIKYDKAIQKILELKFMDYKEFSGLYSSIEIEIIPKQNKYDDFINFDEELNNYFHLYFDDNKKETDRTYLDKEDKITKIKIKIDYQVKSFYKLF